MSDTPLSWDCVDCGRDTAPGFPGKSVAEALPESALDAIVLTATNGCEIYTVREVIWKRAGTPDGCLCVGCLEQRLGRRLKPKDFTRDDPFRRLPGTPRLQKRRKF